MDFWDERVGAAWLSMYRTVRGRRAAKNTLLLFPPRKSLSAASKMWCLLSARGSLAAAVVRPGLPKTMTVVACCDDRPGVAGVA